MKSVKILLPQRKNEGEQERISNLPNIFCFHPGSVVVTPGVQKQGGILRLMTNHKCGIGIKYVLKCFNFILLC